MGFTQEDNPLHMCGLMYNIDGKAARPEDIDIFCFRNWPSYTLDELLPEIVKKVKKVGIPPGLVWVDDQSLVKPLRHTLKAAGEACGFREVIEVEWYPPPSDEEQAYHQY